MPGVPKDDQKALEETQGAEVVDVPLHASRPFGRRRHVRLARQPGQNPFRGTLVVPGLGFTVAPQGGAEGRGRAGDLGQSLFEQLGGPAYQGLLIVRTDRPLGQDILFQGVEPAVHDVAERSLRRISGREPLHQPAVDGLQPVQRGFGLGDLDLGGGEAQLAGEVGQPAGEEGLAAAVLPPDRLEDAPTGTDLPQFLLEASSNRSRPTANASRLLRGTVPRRRASMISSRR